MQVQSMYIYIYAHLNPVPVLLCCWCYGAEVYMHSVRLEWPGANILPALQSYVTTSHLSLTQGAGHTLKSHPTKRYG